jgi:hypothetical protein
MAIKRFGDYETTKAYGDIQALPKGGYVLKVLGAEVCNNSVGQYVKLGCDIVEGEYAEHFNSIRAEHQDWAWVGAYVKSYKPKALPMFKRFCTAVTKSNPGYVFDGQINTDEKTLAGKKIGLVLAEEEYYGNDGEKRTRLYVAREFPVDEIASQKVPAIKLLKEESATTFEPAQNIELPFA